MGRAEFGLQRLMHGVVGLRSALAGNIGQQFGNNRDLYGAFGWKQDVTYADMLMKYSRQGITSRIVNAYPDAIWARPPTIVGNDEAEWAINGKFKKGIIKEFGFTQSLNLYHHIGMADRLCGIGKFSIMVLGFNDISHVSGMATPVGSVVKRGPKPKNAISRKLLWVKPYGYGDVSIEKYTDDPSDPNYGMPEIYKVDVTQKNLVSSVSSGGSDSDSGSFSPVERGLLIHHSRVIHIADCTADSSVEGYPIIQRVFNHLDDMMKISGGAAEALWLGARKGLQFDLDKDVSLGAGDKEKLVEEIEKYVHGLTRVLRTRGVNINDLGADHVDPSPVFNVIMSEISTSSGIPQRIFIGSEQGKLASEQDRSNWAGRIEERRELHAEPRIMRPFIRKLMNAGVIPEGVFSFSWPDPFRMSPLERADAASKQARSATNLQTVVIKGNERGVPVLSIEECRDIIHSHGELRVGIDKGVPKPLEVKSLVVEKEELDSEDEDEDKTKDGDKDKDEDGKKSNSEKSSKPETGKKDDG